MGSRSPRPSSSGRRRSACSCSPTVARAPDRLHYTYGALALGVALSPWFYAPAEGPRRLLWFAGTTLVAGSARGAGVHDGLMRKLWDRIPPLARGLGIVGLIAVVVVVLSLEPVLATVGGILRIAFFLAVAFFLFLLWRERRGDLEAWSDRNRRLFYAAISLAVVAIGLALGSGPRPRRARAGPRARRCVLVVVRVWRRERY